MRGAEEVDGRPNMYTHTHTFGPHMYSYIYIYVYTCTYTHTHIYICICTGGGAAGQWVGGERGPAWGLVVPFVHRDGPGI